MKTSELRVIISGGGTGGHIFPAISIADAIKMKRPDAQILFVGAEGRMEMQRVPAAGYDIKGLPICGFDRKHLLRNVAVLYKIWKSQRLAKQIIREFRPMVAVGVGGYASGPTLNKCADMGIPCLIQEQNSYAGVTNKLLAKKARKICVAYEGMERFFPADKLVLTGNPVRQSLLDSPLSRAEACKVMGLDPDKKTILIVGGSLGARTMNESVLQHLDELEQSGVQVMWQTGKYYHEDIQRQLAAHHPITTLKVTDFIRRQQHLGVLPHRQARDSRAFTQCGRRPPDEECHGPGQQRRRSHGERCRGPRQTHLAGPCHGDRRVAAARPRHQREEDGIARLGKHYRRRSDRNGYTILSIV